jgi:hypothetical protein
MHYSGAANNLCDESGNVLRQLHSKHAISRQKLKWRKKLFFHLLNFLFWTYDCVCFSVAENIFLVMEDLVSMEHLWNNMDRGKLKCLEENQYMSIFHHKAHMDSLGSNLSLCGWRPVSAWPMAWPSPLLGRNYNIRILDKSHRCNTRSRKNAPNSDHPMEKTHPFHQARD